MNIEIIKSQKAEAKKNTSKPVEELQVGDFLYLTMCNLKNDSSVIDVIEEAAVEGHYTNDVLCKIEKIVYCTEADLFSNNFEFGEGGSNSDVFESEEDYNTHYPNPDECEYFYTLVTLVIADSGKFVFADAEGYDYPRYILVRDGYREMFQMEIEQERLSKKKREKAIEAERIQKCEEQKAKLRQEISEKFGFLDPKKSVKANWIAVCKKLFDFPVKVSKHNDYFGNPSITLVCRNSEEYSKVAKVVRELENHFQYNTGECQLSYDGYLGEVVGNVMNDLIPGFFYKIDVE